MEEKLVSIIIPVYNRADTICDAVGSVLGQTYGNLEIIIIDDCSSEDIYGKIQDIKDDRIQYYRNERNMGANYSRNRGILKAKGEYVGFQDSADIWEKDKLEKQVAVFAEHKDIDVVYCETEFIRQDGLAKVVPDKSMKDNDRNDNIYNTLLYTNIIDTPSLLVKRNCLIESGMFDEEMPRLQEWELCLRMAKNLKFRCVNEVLSRGTYRKDSISTDFRRLLAAGALLIKKHRSEMEEQHVIVRNIMKFFRESLSESHNQVDTSILKREFLSAYGEEFLLHYGISEGVLDDMIKDFRFRNYYRIYSSILGRISSNGKMPFDFGGKSVAVYGYGTLGRILYNQLKKEDVKVSCIIDNGNVIDAEVPIYRLSEISGGNVADMVVVTPVYEYLKIKEHLKSAGFNEIVSIETVFMDKRQR